MADKVEKSQTFDEWRVSYNNLVDEVTSLQAPPTISYNMPAPSDGDEGDVWYYIENEPEQ